MGGYQTDTKCVAQRVLGGLEVFTSLNYNGVCKTGPGFAQVCQVYQILILLTFKEVLDWRGKGLKLPLYMDLSAKLHVMENSMFPYRGVI